MAKRRVRKLRKDGVKQHYWVGKKKSVRRKMVYKADNVDINTLFDQTQWHKPRPKPEREFSAERSPPSPLRLKPVQRKGVNIMQLKRELELRALRREQASRAKHGVPKRLPLSKQPKYIREAVAAQELLDDIKAYESMVLAGEDPPWLREHLRRQGIDVDAIKRKYGMA